MAVSKVNRENFIVIHGWMITELGLKGNELLVYSCIYGFSQLEGQTFSGSLQYLADWINGTKRTVINCLKSLVEKGVLFKRENIVNGVKYCEYTAIKVCTGSEKSSIGVVKNFHEGSEKNTPNNIVNNLSNNLSNNIDDNTKVNYQLIADMYNDTCVSFPRLKTLSENRKKAIKARLKVYSVDDFKELFIKAEASDFLKGYNERNWSATFDWLIKADNMAKVLEGNYDNKAKALKPKNSFNNFPQRQYDYDAIARMNYKKAHPSKTIAEDQALKERAERLKERFTS